MLRLNGDWAAAEEQALQACDEVQRLRPVGDRDRLVRGRRDPPVTRRLRGRGGGVPQGEGVVARPAAGARAPAACAGEDRGGEEGDRALARRRRRTRPRADPPARGPGRDRARGRPDLKIGPHRGRRARGARGRVPPGQRADAGVRGARLRLLGPDSPGGEGRRDRRGDAARERARRRGRASARRTRRRRFASCSGGRSARAGDEDGGRTSSTPPGPSSSG